MVLRTSTLKRFFTLTIIFLLSVTTSFGADFYWAKVSNGDYNDAANWNDENGDPIGAIPGPDDNVFLYNITEDPEIVINFPGGNTFFAHDLEAEDAVLNFEGTNINQVSIAIYGSINFSTNVSTVYNTRNVNQWEIKGTPNSGTEHIIKSNGVDFDDFTFNIEGEVLTLGDDFLSTSTFRFYAGTLNAEGIILDTGRLFVGFPGYNDSNAIEKNLFVDGSTINCSAQFYSKFNETDAVQFFGNYKINAPRFFIDDLVLNRLVLTDYNPPYNRDSLSMDVKNTIIEELEIDNEYLTRIGGSMTIQTQLKVNNPGKRIEFSTHENYAIFNELTLNGTVNLPSGGSCDALTTFTVKHSSDYFFKRNSGSVTFNSAFIHNIKTTGGGTFEVSGGKVLGSESFWTSTSEAESIDYYWIGGSGNWFDPAHWALESDGVSQGCVPRIIDNVIIDKFSFSGAGQKIELDYSIGTSCQDFIWETNPLGGIVQLYKPAGYTKATKPHINTGSFVIGSEALFETNPGQLLHQIWLDGSGDLFLDNSLPNLYLNIKGSGSEFELTHDINLSELLSIDAGTINTQNHDIYAPTISGASGEKTFNLGSSHIEVDSLLRFGISADNPITINGAQASVKAKHLQYNGDFIKQIELANNSSKNYAYDMYAEKLILSGSGDVVITDSLVVDSLILMDNASLKIGPNSGDGLRVKKGIRGPDTEGTQATIASNHESFTMTLESPCNLCIQGYVALERVEALDDYVYHAEQGLDNGGNTGITFVPNTFTGPVYWNGYEGQFHELINWSNISGGCPTDLTNLKNASSLVIDEKGYNEDDTIFVSEFLSVADLVFRGENKDLYVQLQDSLWVSSISVSDMKVEVQGDDEGTEERKSLRASKNLRIDNAGKFYFEHLDLKLGRAYPNYDVPVIELENTGGFEPLIICRGNSSVRILGASNSENSATILFGPNTGGNLSNADFFIENESPNDMRFDFQNTKVKSFTIDTPENLDRDYIFLSDFRFSDLTIDDGVVIVEDGVTIKLEGN